MRSKTDVATRFRSLQFRCVGRVRAVLSGRALTGPPCSGPPVSNPCMVCKCLGSHFHRVMTDWENGQQPAARFVPPHLRNGAAPPPPGGAGFVGYFQARPPPPAPGGWGGGGGYDRRGGGRYGGRGGGGGMLAYSRSPSSPVCSFPGRRSQATRRRARGFADVSSLLLESFAACACWPPRPPGRQFQATL